MTQITLGVENLLLEEFSISNAYPNPFNLTDCIDCSVPEKTDVNIYNTVENFNIESDINQLIIHK